MSYQRTIAPVVREVPRWRMAFCHTETGEWIDDNGRAQNIGTYPSLAAILNTARLAEIRLVMLCGAMPGAEGGNVTQGAFETWVKNEEVSQNWQDEGSHFGDVVRADSQAGDDPTIKKRHTETGQRVSLYRSARWFANEPHSARTIRDAFSLLEKILSALWKCPVQLQATPNKTGRWLWERWLDSVHLKASDYTPLHSDLQRIIRNNSGQGRAEICTLPELKTIPGFYCLDARFMYAASLNNLPVGTVQHDTGKEFVPYVRGRYRIRFTVPDDWTHIGLFPCKDTKSGWTYPASPGECAETWCNWTELQLALNRGWNVEICERLLFPEAGKKGGLTDPLATWGNRLIEAYFASQDAPLIKTALRKIVLGTIGGFAERPKVRRVLGSLDDPAFVEGYEKNALGLMKPTDCGNHYYDIEEPPTPKEAVFQHPEWASEVWARCRTRMLYFPQKKNGQTVAEWGALTVPRENVLAIRTDALYLSVNPDWPDDGRPGSMRLKPPTLCTPQNAPHTYAEWRKLRAKGNDHA